MRPSSVSRLANTCKRMPQKLSLKLKPLLFCFIPQALGERLHKFRYCRISSQHLAEEINSCFSSEPQFQAAGPGLEDKILKPSESTHTEIKLSASKAIWRGCGVRGISEGGLILIFLLKAQSIFATTPLFLTALVRPRAEFLLVERQIANHFFTPEIFPKGGKK